MGILFRFKSHLYLKTNLEIMKNNENQIKIITGYRPQ